MHLCNDVLKVYDVLDPGRTILRSNVVFELNCAKIMKAKCDILTKSISKADYDVKLIFNYVIWFNALNFPLIFSYLLLNHWKSLENLMMLFWQKELTKTSWTFEWRKLLLNWIKYCFPVHFDVTDDIFNKVESLLDTKNCHLVPKKEFAILIMVCAICTNLKTAKII